MNETEEIAVKVENLTKSFKIPLEGSSGLKQKIINRLKGKKGFRIFTPLNNINFEVKKGEFFGIVGRNGSGKSTLLKSIASIYTPSTGGVIVNGKLVPFIELGVGFNPELTGRENVFLNGALLGFSRKEMESMYGDIVDFAEIGDFMEEKLKNYSSGMQVRLAFSIAIRAKGDILLLDEVLAVGDEAFQRKCFDYFETIKRNKQTVILVTHDMAIVERFCTKALFLKDGEIKLIGNPDKIAAKYTEANQLQIIKNFEGSEEEAEGEFKVEVLDENRSAVKKIDIGNDIIFKVSWKLDDVYNVGIAIYRQSGERIFANNSLETNLQSDIHNSRTCSYRVKLNVSPGNYFVRVRLLGEKAHETKALMTQGPSFLVVSEKDVDGIVLLDNNWSAE